jgi:hypothetical protein
MDAAADYNFEVARGWESKQIEDQQAEAGRSSVKSGQPMTPNDAARQRAKESLRLSRQRVLQQLEASTNPRHRELLELELNALEEKLRNLNQ